MAVRGEVWPSSPALHYGGLSLGAEQPGPADTPLESSTPSTSPIVSMIYRSPGSASGAKEVSLTNAGTMTKKYSPIFVDSVYQALLASFWRRKALAKFLRQCHISDRFLAGWGDQESKRDLLDRLFAKLDDVPSSQEIIGEMAHILAEQEHFPDLERWEDSPEKIQVARKAVARLRDQVRQLEEAVVDARAREVSKERLREVANERRRSALDLTKLNERLLEMTGRMGTQQAGYDFQVWFYDLMAFCEISNRRPYVHDGRQIDGSITHQGTTYLIELKFTNEQASAIDVDTFHKKVTDKADNTMGIMISMAGYSSTAAKNASGPRTPLLLLDHAHVYLVLTGTMEFGAVLERVRRHSSQTSEAYLKVEDFGG